MQKAMDDMLYLEVVWMVQEVVRKVPEVVLYMLDVVMDDDMYSIYLRGKVIQCG